MTTTLTRSIAHNTGIQLAGRMVGTLCGLVSVAILTRYLGTSGYGAFTTVTGFLQFVGIVVDLGFTLTTVQMISEPNADEPRIVGNIFTLRLVSAILFFGFSSLLVWIFPYPLMVKWGVVAGSLAFLAMTQSQVLVGVFQRHLKMARAAFAEVVGRVVLLVGVAMVAMNHGSFAGIIWALVIANAVQLALTIAFAERLTPFRLRFDRSVLKHILHRTWPIGLSIAFNLVYLKGDVMILSLFRSQSEVGLYGAAYKVLDIVTVIPMMFMGLVLPTLVAAWTDRDSEKFKRRFQKAFDFLILLALPMVAGALVLGRDIMTFVAGVTFRRSGDLLAILIIAAGAVFVSGLYGHTVVAIGKQRASVWGYAIDAILSVIAYLIFIPRFGASGAAWVTVFSEVFIAAYTAILVIKSTRVLPSLGLFGKALFATAFMTLVLYAVPHVHVLVAVLIGAIAYGVFLLVLRAITKETIRELISVGKN